MVDGLRRTSRSISRIPAPCALRSAISSRSWKDRYLPDSGVRLSEGIPPRSRNQREPAACDAPTAIAASSLVRPLAISRQNARSTSRRRDGAPGDFIADLPVNAFIHPAGLPTRTSTLEVLRGPLESALRAPVRVMNEPADLVAVAGALPQPLLESVCGQVGAQRSGAAPAHDAPRVDVHDE